MKIKMLNNCIKVNKRFIYLLFFIISLNLFSYEANFFKEAFEEPEKVIILKVILEDLETVPSDIPKLTNLKELYLDCNELKNISADILKLKKLEVLSMRGNKIEEIPVQIDKLKKLNLTGNSIDKLPGQVGSLKNLEELVLADNLINSLPSNIGNLKKLKVLNLSINNLDSMEVTKIEDLEKLEMLDLSNNFIGDLKVDFKSLKYLKVLIMNEFDTERIKYDIFKFKHNKRQALWHNISTILIFFVVIGIVITGLIFFALQFRIAMKHFKDGKDIQGINDSDLSISKEGLKVKSSVLGVIILVISLAFFYLYLVYVYPLHVVDDSSVTSQKAEKSIK